MSSPPSSAAALAARLLRRHVTATLTSKVASRYFPNEANEDERQREALQEAIEALLDRDDETAPDDIAVRFFAADTGAREGLTRDIAKLVAQRLAASASPLHIPSRSPRLIFDGCGPRLWRLAK
jgi:hypothetical protein